MCKASPEQARHETKAEKRRNILEAAGRCFLRCGLTGASMSDICTEAGIGPGHLYHYFDSKDSIIASFVQMKIEERRDTLIEEICRGEPMKVCPGSTRLRRSVETALIFEIFALAIRDSRIGRIVQVHVDRLQSRLTKFI